MKPIFKVLIIFCLLIFVAVIYMALSIRNDYYKNVRATESYRYAHAVAVSISKYYSTNFKYPENIDGLNLNFSEGLYVGKANFDNQTGVLNIQLAEDNLNEGVFVFNPIISDVDGLSYVCTALNVTKAYIPKECVSKK